MIVKDHMNRTRKWVKISENVGRHFGKKGARKCIEECFIVLPGAKEREREREGGEGYGEDSLSFDFCGVQCHPI